MTMQEFADLVATVLIAAEHGQGPLSEPARIVLVERLLRESTIWTPSEVALHKRHEDQQQGITDAVKMAVAAGKLNGLQFEKGQPS